MQKEPLFTNQAATLLVEVLLSTVLLAFLVMATVASVSDVYEQPLEDGKTSQALFYLEEGLDAVRNIRDGAWNELKYESTGLDLAQAEWAFLGEGTLESFDGYTRTIIFEDVCRDLSDQMVACPGTYTDLYTKKVTVTVSWNDTDEIPHEVYKTEYLTNWASQEWEQSDWTGGDSQTEWSDITRFDTADQQVDFTEPGVLKMGTSCTADNILALDTFDEFSTGTFSNTSYDLDHIELDATGILSGAGTYTSPVFDLLTPSNWTRFTWEPGLPYGKDLPDNGGIETGYAYGGIDMTGNLALYHMDESSGTNIVDSSGLSHNGVLANASLNASGIFGSAINFDGTGDTITDDDAELYLNGLDEITVSVWVKSNIVGTDRGIFITKTPDTFDDVLTLRYDMAGALGGGVNIIKAGIQVGGLEYQLESASNVQTTSWQHLVITWSSGGTLKLYINGVQTTPTYLGTIRVGTISGATTLILGKGTYDTGSTTWNGLMDEFSIWNREFTVEEVMDLYERGLNENLKFQVRACSDATCSTDPFEGPDGTASTYFSESGNSALSIPSFALSQLDNSYQYFQYRAFFNTAVSNTPEFHALTLYYDCNPYISAAILDDTQAEFDLGTYGTGTTFNSSSLQLSSAGLLAGTGTYTSSIHNVEELAPWGTLSWKPGAAYGIDLPDNKAIETGYQDANLDMSSNVLLLHLDETSGTLADSSGSLNPATSSGGLLYAQAGKYLNALQFDGLDDTLTVADSASLDLTSEMTLEAWFYPTGNSQPSVDIGAAVTTNFNHAPTDGTQVDVQHISGNVYALAYRGLANDGYISTIQINSDGTVSSVLSTYEFDPADCQYPDITLVSGNIYAIAYQGVANDGFIVTLNISPLGVILPLPIDLYEFDTADGWAPEILKVSGNIFVVAYEGLLTDGYIKTIDIDPSGNIGATIRSYNFSPPNGQEIDLIQISPGYFAVAYQQVGDDGFISTFSVDGAGNISTLIDTYEFDPTFANWPSVVHVSGTIYAIAYADTQGYVVTIDIQDNGIIGNSLIDTMQYSNSSSNLNHMISLSSGAYAVAYQSGSFDGFVSAFRISPSGDISSPVDDTLKFHDASGATTEYPNMLLIDHDTLAIAYQNQFLDGYIATIPYSVRIPGIFKAGAYQLHVDSDEVTGTVNTTTVSGTSIPGWNHAVLTYDKNLSSNQLKLYLNGSLIDSENLTGDINVNTSILKIGEYYPGLMDEVAIYNQALSASEVLAHYERGIFSISLKIRACDDAACSGESFLGFDGTSSSSFTEANNATLSYPADLDISFLPDSSYFQYQVNLNSLNPSSSPKLYFLAADYLGSNPDLGGAFETEAELISSAFDMGDASAVQILEWDELMPETGTYDIQIQLRTAPDVNGLPGTWTSWYGADGIGTYFTNPQGTIVPPELNGNQWVQYRVVLTGDGVDTPVLEGIQINYR